MNPLVAGFGLIFISAICAGIFGLQYRLRRKYTVDNMALLSMFSATIVVPLVVSQFIIPGWPSAIAAVSTATIFTIAVFGFGWGMGAITYAFGISALGMALGGAIIKGLSTAVGAIIPLIRHGASIPVDVKAYTLVGIALLVVGTAICGKGGIVRERELGLQPDPDPAHIPPLDAFAEASEWVVDKQKEADDNAPAMVVVKQAPPPVPAAVPVKKPLGRTFALGLTWCVISGLLSACANLGYDWAAPLGTASAQQGHAEMFATLIRWMPMYWGGITALLIFTGISMFKSNTWRNYVAKGSFREFALASSMGIVHFMAQIPYGMGAFFLGKMGTTIGWAFYLGAALVVETAIGFMTGEWKGTTSRARQTLYLGLGVLFIAMLFLAYANSLATEG